LPLVHCLTACHSLLLWFTFGFCRLLVLPTGSASHLCTFLFCLPLTRSGSNAATSLTPPWFHLVCHACPPLGSACCLPASAATAAACLPACHLCTSFPVLPTCLVHHTLPCACLLPSFLLHLLDWILPPALPFLPAPFCTHHCRLRFTASFWFPAMVSFCLPPRHHACTWVLPPTCHSPRLPATPAVSASGCRHHVSALDYAWFWFPLNALLVWITRLFTACAFYLALLPERCHLLLIPTSFHWFTALVITPGSAFWLLPRLARTPALPLRHIWFTSPCLLNALTLPAANTACLLRLPPAAAHLVAAYLTLPWVALDLRLLRLVTASHSCPWFCLRLPPRPRGLHCTTTCRFCLPAVHLDASGFLASRGLPAPACLPALPACHTGLRVLPAVLPAFCLTHLVARYLVCLPA